MTSLSDSLKLLIGEHGAIHQIVNVPPSEGKPDGHLMLEFQDGHVEIKTELCLCRDHLEKLGAVTGLQPRKVEWALKQSKVTDFVVWWNPHSSQKTDPE